MTIKIITHSVYRVSIAVTPDRHKLAFERMFLGLPNKSQVEAYIHQLMRKDKRTDDLSQRIREGREKCLALLDTYGLPSVEEYPWGEIQKPEGRIELDRMKNVIQVEESR